MLENFISSFNVFFLLYGLLYGGVFFLMSVISTLSIGEYIKKRKFFNSVSFAKKENFIPISILVPAYNEEVTIIDSIKSLLEVDYPKYEIIIINDGSKDKTEELLINEFGLIRVKSEINKKIKCKPITATYENIINGVKVTLASKVNGGKADSLNLGINLCKYPLFISLDADSVLKRDALLKIVEPFIEDDKTIAVGGSIKVANSTVIKNGRIINERIPKKLIVLFQALEYIRVFTSTRVAFDKVNANMIVSGAFGIFNKKKVMAIGGYKADSLGEDMDLILKLHNYSIKNDLDYKIAYVIDAICLSQVPEKYSDLRKQRIRWNTGMLQSISANRDIFKNKKNPFVGYMGFVYYLFFEILSPIVEVTGLAIIAVGALLDIIPASMISLYLIVFIIYNTVITWISINLNSYVSNLKTSRKMKITLYIMSILENFGFRQLNLLFRVESLLTYKFKTHKWGKIERKKMA